MPRSSREKKPEHQRLRSQEVGQRTSNSLGNAESPTGGDGYTPPSKNTHMSNVQQLIDQSKSNLNRKMLKTNKKNVITIHKNQAQKPKQTPEVNEIDDNLVQLRFVRGRFSPFWVW